MDPYEENAKKVLSPLDKISNNRLEEKSGEEDSSDSEVSEFDSATLASVEQEDEVSDYRSLNDISESLVDHLADLRKQLIKGVAVFLLFLSLYFQQ